MPPALGAHYTEGERAVLCIIAGEVKRHGICDWPIGTIAAKAGVGRSTVQNALHEARRHSHIAVQARPRPGQKNLTNVVSIINRDWLEWIKRAPSAAKSLEPVVRGKQARPTAVAECGVIGSKTLNPTKIIELNTGADAQPMPPEPSVKPTDQKGAFDEGASGNTDRSPSTVAVERPQEPPKSPPATYQPGLFGADVINFDTVAGKLSSSTCTAIRAEYRARGLSQGQFAAEIGLSQAQLCNVLKGRFGLSAGATARLHGWLQRRIA
jgi:lambda repressor-like predicted transcriptional regulator